VLNIDSTSPPLLTGVPEVTGAAAGFTVTFSAPADFTTAWHWELEDPFGGDSCSFPGVVGDVACTVHETAEDTVVKTWAAAGDYHHNVVASNCATAAIDTASGLFTLEAGVQPDIESFNLDVSEIQVGGDCCGDPVLAGFTCRAGAPVLFKVTMVEAGAFQFQFDWERASEGATPSYAPESPASNPTPTEWLFSHTFAQTGSMYPKTKAISGAFFAEKDFIKYPLTIVSGTPTCQ
jgi:hypothetical protein